MQLNLKLNSMFDINESIINTFKDGKYHNVKLSTTKLEVELDKKDERYISRLRNVKIIYKKSDGGILILIGNLGCSFQQPMGGEFFLKKIAEETTDFEDIKGVEAEVMFGSLNIDRIQAVQKYLEELHNSSDFQFNISQFEEFIEIFEYYKSLSSELNNNFSFKIANISKPYYYLKSDQKEVDLNFKEEVKDQDGILKGYIIDNNEYIYLKNEIKDKIHLLIDIYINGGNFEYKKIKSIGEDSLYLSNLFSISEKEIKNLKNFTPLNINIQKEQIIISGELRSDFDYEQDYSYLNLYDMGQKIKIDSIDNSLRLINQGATGAALELLEYLIGAKPMPNNNARRRKSATKEKYMRGLNESQKQAFLMATDGQPVSLIKGPPGTGKTHVINAIIQYITKELGEKVVVSSQTHIAIDNVLDKLMENYDLIIPNRITNKRNKYSDSEIDRTLFKTWGSKFLSHNSNTTDEHLSKSIEKSLMNFKGEEKFKYSERISSSDYLVIGATTTTSAIAGKKGLEVLRGYDWLIIDEVSKCPITEVLRYLPYINKIILVGDDFQLAPILEFNLEDVKELQTYKQNPEMFEKMQLIYEKSVFADVLEKSIKSNRLVLLNENYRSVNDVLTTYNIFYDNQLVGRREEIRPEKVQFVNQIGSYNDKNVFFVEVLGGQEAKDGTSRFNLEEIKATAYILEDIMNKTINPEKVTVSAIFPYAAQISKFQKNNVKLINSAKKLFKSFEIDTVDAFQGKESDIILVNTVVTDASQRNFLNDFRRINVSMSRARDKLIIFGNKITLSKIEMQIFGGSKRNFFKDIIDFIRNQGMIINYKEGEIKHEIKSKSGIKIA